MSTMTMSFGRHTLSVALNGGEAAKRLAEALPLSFDMSRWGDGEYYGKLPVPVGSAEKRREVFEVGEVALWPDGNAFCIFFGPTPVSRGAEPRMASPGIPLGTIVGDAGVFAELGPRLNVTLGA